MKKDKDFKEEKEAKEIPYLGKGRNKTVKHYLESLAAEEADQSLEELEYFDSDINLNPLEENGEI